jgi:hypothetical protein
MQQQFSWELVLLQPVWTIRSCTAVLQLIFDLEALLVAVQRIQVPSEFLPTPEHTTGLSHHSATAMS